MHEHATANDVVAQEGLYSYRFEQQFYRSRLSTELVSNAKRVSKPLKENLPPEHYKEPGVGTSDVSPFNI